MTDPVHPPIRTVVDAGVTMWAIEIDDDERALLVRLLGELRSMLADDAAAMPMTVAQRLFPPAFLDDPDKNAEYHRLMRDELIASRVDRIDTVVGVLAPDGPDRLDEAQTVALMQSLNAVRVALGTVLDVGEDDDDVDDDDSPELQLYHYLSWLLEWTVRSLSG